MDLNLRQLTPTRYTINKPKKQRRAWKHRLDSEYDKAMKVWAKEWITQRLKEHDGNRAHTAKAIGMARSRLHTLIQVMKISVPGPGPGNPYAKTKRGCVFVINGRVCGYSPQWHSNAPAIDNIHDYVAPPAAHPDEEAV